MQGVLARQPVRGGEVMDVLDMPGCVIRIWQLPAVNR